ncbi:MAG: hypothetical protein HY077_14600 [Elusimicrobia bacterium]|nr:hypothetical protein [Elusimicrobiota bacterium]
MSDWERKLGDRLKRLPPLKAPASLLPMVMERIEARTRWAWWAWPAAARAASLAGLAGAAGAVAFAASRLASWLQAAPSAVPARALGMLASAHNGAAAALGRALWVVLSSLGQPLLVPVLLTYLLCAGGAVFFWQLASRPRGLRHIEEGV